MKIYFNIIKNLITFIVFLLMLPFLCFSSNIINTTNSDLGVANYIEETINIDTSAKPVYATISTPIYEGEVFVHDNVKYKKGTFLGNFRLSGYCSCTICTNGTGITASGKHVRANHTVSADTKVLPLGTFIILEGESNHSKNYNGVYQVEDIGGHIKEKLIDIYQPTHDFACYVTHFGKVYSNVYLAIPLDEDPPTVKN